MESNVPLYLPSIGRLLDFAHRGSTTLSERRLKEHGLTLKQWVPLTALWRGSPMTEGELSEYTRMSPSSLNRLLDRMEAKALVKRRKDPEDRRRVLVDLGPAGAELSGLLGFYEEVNDVLTKGMTQMERVQMVSLMEKMVANLEGVLQD